MHKSLNLQVVLAGLQVLPQGNHVYPVRLEISQDLLHFIQGLTQASISPDLVTTSGHLSL